ncbi:DUF4136 domain-containing protein [Tellurirhabdus rosea]|uniref:DUF4136 domain-containing protein n=1 Tax=Tellurirhabdus rosea TaxID=2674997 RepID=UPI00225BBE9A|nr:DUF4136 domain-containing protein [Tellurirhabdus rosea]
MRKSLLLVTFVAFFWNCSRVAVDYNKNVNFDKYKTYALMDSDVQAGKNPLYYSDLATQNVENAVTTVLKEKGLQESNRRPDLLIGYHFFVEKKTRTVQDPYPLYGPYYGWGRWGYRGWAPTWYGWGGPQTRTEQYNEGTVVVDLVDARTRRLVWRGSVEEAVTDPARITTKLTKDVRKILERYPDREKS